MDIFNTTLKSAFEHLNAFPVKTFAEKPHKKLAERFIKSGDFLWNGGMFIWNIETFFSELESHMPDLSTQLNKIEKRIFSNQDFFQIMEQYRTGFNRLRFA